MSIPRKNSLPASVDEDTQFWVMYHKGRTDTHGSLVSHNCRFSNREEAVARCSVEMAERSVEQKLKGIYFSVQLQKVTDG